MKVRKGRRKYLVVLNRMTHEVHLAKSGGRYDMIMYRNTLGLPMFDCTLSEAKHNIKVAISKGYHLVVKKY